MVKPQDFLDQVEIYLEGRGRKLERRGRLDPLAYLAYRISVEPDQYEEFKQILRAAAEDIQSRLDIFFSATGELQYIDIKTTFAPPEQNKSNEGATADRLMAEEALAKYYLAQFEITQLRARAEKHDTQAGEARAEAQRERRRADEAEVSVASLKLELEKLNHVRSTRDDVKRLEAELAATKRQKATLETTNTDLQQQLVATAESYTKYRKKRDDHRCEVTGLRLLKETSCGCMILVDHRRCTGLLHLSIEANTNIGTELMNAVQGQVSEEAEELTDSQMKAIAKKEKEELHLVLRPVLWTPQSNRKPPPGILGSGMRNLKRSMKRFLEDPCPDQKKLSTYTVRRLGDMP